jgi:branched-chain amino acid aminotransferase
MKPYCFAKDSIIKSDQANIHPADIGLIRGYAIFDFFRTVNYRPLFLSDYLDRFIGSADKTAIPLGLTKQELTDTIQELIQKNDLKEGGIRMVLSGGVSPNHFSPAEGSLFIFCEDLQMPSQEKYEKGVKLIGSEYVRPIATVKTTNYSQAVYSSLNWKAENVEDLIYHSKGIISESSRSNIFIVKDGKLATPKSNILLGITRKNILKLAPDTEIRDITWEELLQADEVFMSSTTKKILPVTQIDDTVINSGKPGEVSLSLLARFNELEKKSSE